MRNLKIILAGLVAGFLLAACGPSREERHQMFVAQCVPSGFKPAQCEVLWQLKAASDDAKASADAAFITSMASIGSSSGGRR